MGCCPQSYARGPKYWKCKQCTASYRDIKSSHRISATVKGHGERNTRQSRQRVRRFDDRSGKGKIFNNTEREALRRTSDSSFPTRAVSFVVDPCLSQHVAHLAATTETCACFPFPACSSEVDI